MPFFDFFEMSDRMYAFLPIFLEKSRNIYAFLLYFSKNMEKGMLFYRVFQKNPIERMNFIGSFKKCGKHFAFLSNFSKHAVKNHDKIVKFFKMR